MISPALVSVNTTGGGVTSMFPMLHRYCHHQYPMLGFLLYKSIYFMACRYIFSRSNILLVCRRLWLIGSVLAVVITTSKIKPLSTCFHSIALWTFDILTFWSSFSEHTGKSFQSMCKVTLNELLTKEVAKFHPIMKNNKLSHGDNKYLNFSRYLQEKEKSKEMVIIWGLGYVSKLDYFIMYTSYILKYILYTML